MTNLLQAPRAPCPHGTPSHATRSCCTPLVIVKGSAARVGRSPAACAAVMLLPGAMSFLRASHGGINVLMPKNGRGFCATAQGVSAGFGGRSRSRREAALRKSRYRCLAMVGGGDGAGDSPPSSYDFAKRATRFECFFTDVEGCDGRGAPVSVTLLPDKAGFEGWLGSQSSSARSWLKSLGHDTHKPGRVIMVPSATTDGEGDLSLSEVAYCLGEGDESAVSPFALCSLRDQLPAGVYAFRGAEGPLAEPDTAALSWALGGYSFDRYTKTRSATCAADTNGPGASASAEGGKEKSEGKVLVWPEGANRRAVAAAAASIYLVRDLITTPCEHMGPQHLEAVFGSLAQEFGATTRVIKGDDLLKEGDSYPQIHAVGRAAGVGREPRLLDLSWTPADAEEGDLPKVTLVGKGVCFDTGGLDIKPAAGMLTMKKDMGGGAQVIGLARMIMAQNLPVRLRVLVPAVENAINGNAFRPGDVIVARNGKTSEIGNTDAEGRLVLADALVEASSESPDLLIDCATLTGAARVALGTEVPVVFCNDEDVAAKLHSLSGGVCDQVWRLPLWEGYRKQLSSKIADLKNVGSGGYGGAITAALYLDEFVGTKASSSSSSAEGQPLQSSSGSSGATKLSWIHMDFMAFNQASKPGRPEGGEAQGMRALYALLVDMFSS